MICELSKEDKKWISVGRSDFEGSVSNPRWQASLSANPSNFALQWLALRWKKIPSIAQLSVVGYKVRKT